MSSTSAPARHENGFGKLPLQFIPNRGQRDKAVAFYVEGRDKAIYFTAEGLTFVFVNADSDPGAAPPAPRWVVKLDFVDARKGARPAGLERSGAVISYFKGGPEAWKAGLAAYSKLIYRDLWPGIDLIYSGTFARMKYEFVVRPDADPSRIALAYRGAESVALTADGRLGIKTPAGGFEDDAPIAYQETDEGRHTVPVTYDLDGERYGFNVAAYDRNRPLIIDPSSLVYCGFIGGQGSEMGAGIAVDVDGSAYVVGSTSSSESTFPTTVGPDLTFNEGSEDAFIAKVRPDGTGLVYCGFIGGNATDIATKVAVDALGQAYIAGGTDSPESTFPVTAGPDLTYNGGGPDAFVAKVDPSGRSLLYCGYIGGASFDLAMGLAVDGLGNAYVSGATVSDETTFPVKVGPDLTFNGPTYDAFVAKVDPAGTALAYCGYIGGFYDDISQGIAVDGSGNAYVSGTTASSERDGFPVVAGPNLTFLGDLDVFVAKVNPAGAALDYCGYLGWVWIDTDAGIAVDIAGNAYVARSYYSDVEPANASVYKVSPSGGYVYDRSIGGMGDDTAGGVAVDAWGNAYLTGATNSNTTTFPETVGPGLVRKYHGDNHDAFVAKIDPSGSGSLVYCGFIGGFGDDHPSGIAVDGSGNAYIAGTMTDGDWAYFPAIVGPGLTYNGGDSDAFVAKVPPIPAVSNPTLTSVQPSSAMAGDTPLTVTLEGSDFVYGAYTYWRGSPRPATFVSDTRLTSTSIPSDMWYTGVIDINVRNPDGQPAGPVSVSVYSPVPVLDSFYPASVLAYGNLTRFRLQGSGFLRSSTVRWNSAVLSAGWSYVSSSALDANIPQADLIRGGEFTVTVENPTPGGGITAPRIFRIATFMLSSDPPSVTVSAGQAASFAILVTPQYGSFDAAVDLKCVGLPPGCSASFSVSSPIPGADPVSVALTLRTKASSASLTAAALGPTALLPPSLGLLLVAAAFIRPRRLVASARQQRMGRWLAAGALALLVLVMATCGAGGPDGGGTPSGTYQITVEGLSGHLRVTTPITLTIR